MLSRTASTILRRSAARCMSTEAVSTAMTLNFSLPHETIYDGATVASVIIPGAEGEYGVTVDHVPTVSQLKPGVLQILHDDGETEKYFCSGGFALTHPNSVTVRCCCNFCIPYTHCPNPRHSNCFLFRIFLAQRPSNWTTLIKQQFLQTMQRLSLLHLLQQVVPWRKPKP